MIVTDVGVEIGVAGIHHDLAQQLCLDELVQRIVDSRERHPDRRLDRFAVQLLGGDVPVTLLEQESGQRQPLPGRPQMRRAQHSRALVKGRDAVMTLISERSGQARNHASSGTAMAQPVCQTGAASAVAA